MRSPAAAAWALRVAVGGSGSVPGSIAAAVRRAVVTRGRHRNRGGPWPTRARRRVARRLVRTHRVRGAGWGCRPQRRWPCAVQRRQLREGCDGRQRRRVPVPVGVPAHAHGRAGHRCRAQWRWSQRGRRWRVRQKCARHARPWCRSGAEWGRLGIVLGVSARCRSWSRGRPRRLRWSVLVLVRG